jgi:hypothetical protein
MRLESGAVGEAIGRSREQIANARDSLSLFLFAVGPRHARIFACPRRDETDFNECPDPRS